LEVKPKGQCVFSKYYFGFQPELQIEVMISCYRIGFSFYLDVTVACAISVSEKGEVISTHYKLFSADIRDVPKLDSVIRMAEMDPR